MTGVQTCALPICYADKSGSTTLKPQYSAAYAFNEDTNDVAPVAVDGKFGYIKKDGEFVAQPQYSFAGSFSDKGLAKVTDENGNVGFVDSRGRNVMSGHTCFACHNAIPVFTPYLLAV